MLTLAIHYLIPLLGTIYSKSQYNKWIAYWILLLALNAVAKPVFCFILGANGGAFITFSAGAGLLFFCKENRVLVCWCLGRITNRISRHRPSTLLTIERNRIWTHQQIPPCIFKLICSACQSSIIASTLPFLVINYHLWDKLLFSSAWDLMQLLSLVLKDRK